jgi:aldehyde dehydrogenase (NAD+)
MDFLTSLGLKPLNPCASSGLSWLFNEQSAAVSVVSPVDGKIIANVQHAGAVQYQHIVEVAEVAASYWRQQPAPKRGDIVRQIGDALRANKEALGQLVSYEMGKSLQEGLGEVQEMIDICDFAVGLSRQLCGSTMHSERPGHRMYEQYHPLGVVGVISAFNFPVAVWAWNAMIAAVCGNVTIWKPSEKTPLTALACQHILQRVLADNALPEGIFNLVIGTGDTIGELMLEDSRVALVSVTGSTRVGRHAAQKIAARFGKSILELGGNNAIIITEHADLALAIPAVVFGAVGTAGQRCTTTRRVIVHADVYDKVKQSLVSAYQKLRIGDPLDQQNHVGPLIDQSAVAAFQAAIMQAQQQGGTVLTGGDVLNGEQYASGCYVRPAIVEAQNHYPAVQQETFAPLLYLLRYEGDLTEAIAMQNAVAQGLSSAIFTTQLQQAEQFLACSGSDCGIANVNIGTSGAEIGGAFGGEKETGGGRESGSDAWKAYMRRQTNTINYSSTMPLAQGIKFEL